MEPKHPDPPLSDLSRKDLLNLLSANTTVIVRLQELLSEQLLEQGTRSRSRHRSRAVGRATASNPLESHLQHSNASENPAGIFPSVEIRDGSVASLASRTRLSTRVKDPEPLNDEVNPTFEAWRLLVEGKLLDNADHYPDKDSQVRAIFRWTTGEAQRHLKPKMLRNDFRTLEDALTDTGASAYLLSYQCLACATNIQAHEDPHNYLGPPYRRSRL